MLQLKCVKYYGPFILKENRDQFLHPTERIDVSTHKTRYNIKLGYTDNEKKNLMMGMVMIYTT